jgi:DNA polymerase III delta prime subunit
LISTVDAYRGQARVLRLLGSSLAQGRLAGTLLISGQRGLGKTTLATIIARALTCERNREGQAMRLWFCGECYACRSIAGGEQNEYVLVRPTGTDIKVEQLDEKSGVLYSFSLHPQQLSHRVLVLDEAHCLNATTGNQMLKLFEEPPQHSVFILVTDKPELMLPTIHSRSLKIPLAPEPEAALRGYLSLDLPQADSDAITQAAALAAGRYVDAVALTQVPQWREAVRQLAQALQRASRLPEQAHAAMEYEFAFLWAKELADLNLTQAEAEKAVEKPRVNELKRQALIAAYDRALLLVLRDTSPGAGFLKARRNFIARVNQNVDTTLAQAAFEVELGEL